MVVVHIYLLCISIFTTNTATTITSTTCDEDDNDDFSVSNDFSVACVRGLLFTESTYVIPAQDKQESERTLSHTRLFSSALVVLAWS